MQVNISGDRGLPGNRPGSIDNRPRDNGRRILVILQDARSLTTLSPPTCILNYSEYKYCKFARISNKNVRRADVQSGL